MTEPNEPSSSSDELETAPSGRIAGLKARAEQYRTDLEGRPRIGFMLRSVRRFEEMEGKHLSLVIAMNMFVAIIPLFIVGYAVLVAFNPDRSFGSFVADAFHLTGSTARTVDETFSNARSGRNTALSISVISLLITGLDVSATVQLAYARAFRVAPLRGVRKYLRGGAWLIIMIVVTGAGLALRGVVADHSHWVLVVVVPLYLLLQFGFYLVTPRLLLDFPFVWRNLMPGAAVSTAAVVVVSAFSSFQLHRWLSGYGHAYGSFGIALAVIAYAGLIALFWVWIAAVMGTYWENKAGSAAVAVMHERSAEVAARS